MNAKPTARSTASATTESTTTSTPTAGEQLVRAQETERRIAGIGIPKQELAAKAGIDRGTLGRLLKADPRISDRTWVKVERVLSQLEVEYGINAGGVGSAFEKDEAEQVTSTVEYEGAKITLSGRADAVAEAIRKVLSGE